MDEKVVLDAEDIQRTLVRIPHEIVERNAAETVAIVGIHRRGAILAARLHALLEELTGTEVPLGDVDISFYRDVLYTGRTVRAAIDAVFDYGRPERVQLAVLTDRGHRELPIRPDYVGKNLPTAQAERVNVRVEEIDGVDEVTISGSGSAVPFPDRPKELA